MNWRTLGSVVVMLLLFDPTGQISVRNNSGSPDSNRVVNTGSDQSPWTSDPIFSELDFQSHNSSKRAAWDLYAMVKCSTGCNPLVFKGYGCFCGFLGHGNPVDGIDRCCKMHDWCYTTTSCMNLQYQLPYFVPYKWKCNGGAPYCIRGKTKYSGHGSCSHQLCECDREFASCLADYPCPHKKAMCMSPWRYWQNLFMGLGTGMSMDPGHHQRSLHGRPHFAKPRPLVNHPPPIFHENRVNVEFGK